jgi:transcriptional regulator with XRE-family HTH domain
MVIVIGERLRAVRQSQHLSLNHVAEKAHISVATLSRIETNKQTLDLGVFLILAKILNTPPQEFLTDGSEAEGTDPLVTRITSLDSRERTMLWRDLAAARRDGGRTARRSQARNISNQVEELLAQVDFLREEIESVQQRVKRR